MAILNKVVQEEEQGMRLDRWLKHHFPAAPKTLVFKLLRKKAITVNGKKATPDYALQAWDMVKVPPSCSEGVAPKPKDPLKNVSEYAVADFAETVIYQDKHVIAINKPAGLAVQGGPDVKISVDRLAYSLKGNYQTAPKLVHRLDKDTSGVLLLARTQEAAQYLTGLFRSKKPITKTYYALVVGVPEPQEGWINLPIAQGTGKGKEMMEVNEKEGQHAKTFYRVLEYVHGIAALVELVPYTGRKHQLRVHMEAIGHPIVGDGKYAGRSAMLEDADNQLHLHAGSVEFESPDGKHLTIKAPLPKHISKSLKHFGLTNPLK